MMSTFQVLVYIALFITLVSTASLGDEKTAAKDETQNLMKRLLNTLHEMEVEDSPADDNPPPTQGKEKRGINDLHNTNQCQVYTMAPSSNPIISHGAYSANINRCYFINVNQRISLNFQSIGLERTSPCTADFIEIRQNYGNSERGEWVGRYCGQSAPNLVVQGPVYIRFYADYSIGGNGWSIQYSNPTGANSCTTQWASSGAGFASPGWPQQYPAHQDTCVILKGSGIGFSLTSFELEPPAGSTCIYDYVTVWDGTTERRYCGYSVPMLPASGPITLKFHSDLNGNYAGFNMRISG